MIVGDTCGSCRTSALERDHRNLAHTVSFAEPGDNEMHTPNDHSSIGNKKGNDQHLSSGMVDFEIEN